ncbi:MAG: dTDP-4-dehydrorhamnose 3,5-epimerase [Rhodocyclaceae bacterium]
MKFTPLSLDGSVIIELEPIGDERGSFTRTFCEREFISNGLNSKVAQRNLSFNKQRGTLRGLHYQAPPHAEAKLIRCTRGAVFDVIVDLRPWSPRFLEWFGIELREGDGKMLFVPERFAHGYQTLEDNTELDYQMSVFFEPAFQKGIRWNDPALSISWPNGNRIISEKDSSFPLLSEIDLGSS